MRNLILRAAKTFHPITGEVRVLAWWECLTCDCMAHVCACSLE